MKKLAVALMLLAICVGCAPKSPLPRVVAAGPEDVKDCIYVDEVDASRRTTADAKRRIRNSAALLGATHVVWNIKEAPPQAPGNNNVNVNLNVTDLGIGNVVQDRGGRSLVYLSAKAYRCASLLTSLQQEEKDPADETTPEEVVVQTNQLPKLVE